MQGRIPLSLKVSAVLVSFILLTLVISGFFGLKRAKHALYLAKLKSVETVLVHFVNTIRIPLLGDDTLSLAILNNEMTKGRNFLYVTILDSKGIIKIHSDSSGKGTAFRPSGVPAGAGEKGQVKVSTLVLEGVRALDFSMPVTFKEKTLGSVHLGLSQQSLQDEVEKESRPTLYIFVFSGLGVVLLGIGAALLISRRLTRPIARLQSALQGVGRGRLGHRIPEIPNNEMGDLTMAFNQMCLRLHKDFTEAEGVTQRISSDWFTPSDFAGLDFEPSRISRKQVSVLFAGVKGFRAYAETKTPEEVLKDLNEYFGLATECILAGGGYVDKYIGDAIIGVFGSDPPRGDHTERAVRSAVAMQKALRDGSENGNELFHRVSIGISSGVVLSGNLGPSSKREYTFIGESFKVAYVLNVLAEEGEIVISREVYELIENLVSVEPLPPREKMARTEPWENFRLRHILDKRDHDG
ncbi:MAG: adenylate/guanylate cyclase domain-containing protein [Desulfatiglandales bacterium]